ncbi:hypothetical protein SAMN04489867_2653 [Pedococcus dokdonensis]|uniref:Uncharacterized protein n=1 Tax=Pedococcus dokdonensis TaxID=443156 RepID=A0A1H0T636_9MICO|nr:hypothetical protein [Pedococcus dokdonensis]SDP49434.1 hypothetical protein SAMN04489867_2653 [Pedococcus dokdonensis]
MEHRPGEEGLDRRPDGVSDATVEAVGKLSEAFETIEEVRGRLYGLHRLTGSADLALGDAVEQLRQAGHAELADTLDRELVGRNVVTGRWTFQVVEDFEDGYYATWKRLEQQVRDELMAGRRHVYEAEMKADCRTEDEPGHEATPDDVE